MSSVNGYMSLLWMLLGRDMTWWMGYYDLGALGCCYCLLFECVEFVGVKVLEWIVRVEVVRHNDTIVLIAHSGGVTVHLQSGFEWFLLLHCLRLRISTDW